MWTNLVSGRNRKENTCETLAFVSRFFFLIIVNLTPVFIF